jgi:hypothetical protein
MAFQKHQHPRLYFSREELLALREAAQGGLRAEVLARLKTMCERLLDPNDAIYLDYRERVKPMWRERKGIFTWHPSLSLLAFGYAFTGDERYGVAARDALIVTIENDLADVEAQCYGNSYRGWRREPGHDKFNYAWSACNVYDLCYELFSEEQRQTFIEHALESIAIIKDDKLLLSQDIGQTISNRGGRGLLAVFGLWPLAIEGDVELPEIEEYLVSATISAESYLHVSFDQDGACFDGPSYGSVLNHVYYFSRMLARSGRADLLRGRRWREYSHHLVHEILPGGYTLNNLNDCSTPCGTVAPVLFLMGSAEGAVIPWLARQLDLHPCRIEEADDDVGSALFDVASPLFLMNWRDDVPTKTPQELGYPLSRLFSQRGIASMRTGWEENDYLVSHRCGKEMFRMHKQSDQNHLALYALGEKFLVDEGYGQSDFNRMASMSETVNRYFGRSDVHNTVLIDGRGQNGNQIDVGWAEGRLIDFQHTSQFDTSLGDAGAAYGKDHTIESAMRRTVFVRAAEHPFLIVIDNLCVGDGVAHVYEVLWRTARDNRIETDKGTFRIIGQSSDCYGRVLFPDEAELETRVHFNLPQLRVKTRGATLKMVTVFVPLARGEVPPHFECQPTEQGDFHLTVRDGAMRHLIQAGTRTSQPLGTPLPIYYERQLV